MLSVKDFADMVEAYNEMKTVERWEYAYWVANIISPHMRRPVKAQTLMRPFLKPESKAEKAKDAEEFFADFAEQRKEAGFG